MNKIKYPVSLNCPLSKRGRAKVAMLGAIFGDGWTRHGLGVEFGQSSTITFDECREICKRKTNETIFPGMCEITWGDEDTP